MTETAQVIVVGSGPAGVSAAWPLVHAGIRVLMIDASRGSQSIAPVSRPIARFREDPNSWKDRFGADLAALESADNLSPKFATPQARALRGDFDGRSGVVGRGFVTAGSLARGGLSKIWGALAQPFEDEEFADFPFGGSTLGPSYESIMRRIGVSGGPGCGPDSLASAAARRLFARYRQGCAGFALQPAMNAVLEAMQDGRGECTHCGLCLFGCSRGSIYDSAGEIPALQRHANFTYRPDHFVFGLRGDGPDHVLDVEADGRRKELRAPILVMAAGAIASTGLILRRLNYLERQVRLLTNPAAATAFLIPDLVGRDLPDQSFGLGQLFYRLKTPYGDASGVVYGVDTLPLDLLAARMPASRPFALRLAHALAPALLMATCYIPGSFSRNTLRVEEHDGEGRIIVEGTRTREASLALRAALRQLKRNLFRLGAIPLPGSTTFLQPGADAHYGGSLPMGGAGPISTSQWGEIGEGLFLVDGAALSALPATHPTLTIMANADRIGHEIARRLGSVASSSMSLRETA